MGVFFVGGIAFNTVALYAIQRQAYPITPQILHDGSEVNLRGSRHNKSLATKSTLAFFLFIYLWGLGLLARHFYSGGELYFIGKETWL